MLDPLGKFLTSLFGVLPKLYSLYRDNKQEDKIVELFESYFILMSLTLTADGIITLARGRDVIKFSELTDKELEAHYSHVQSYLTLQFQRLKRLGDIFMSNPTIDLLDSKIKLDLQSAIGDKEKGLYTLGVGLFFNQIFGNAKKENEPEKEFKVRIVKEKYDFAASVTKADSIEVSEQAEIIDKLKGLSEQYRSLLDSLVEPKYKILLAKRAKELSDTYSVRI
ncbi:hypothetical protein RYR54_003431 [Aeromonas sobria]|nr:hypothetical protein [Aeromonas sobria]